MSEPIHSEEFTIRSSPEQVRRARTWLGRIIAQAGWNEDEAHDLAVALTEVCSNVHRHAYDGRTEGRIDLKVEVRQEKARVSIRDYGKPFDGRSYPAPDLSQPAEGGYGIYLIRKLCDRVHYEPLEVGSRVELFKSRRLAEHGSGASSAEAAEE